MLRSSIALFALVLSLIGCYAADYLTTINLAGVDDGTIVTLLDSDTGAIIDSIPVSNGKIEFRSNSYEPCIVDVKVGDDKCGDFMLSDADIVHDVNFEDIPGGVRRTWLTRGGYNDDYKSFQQRYLDMKAELGSAATTQCRDSIKSVIKSFTVDALRENADNIFGYYLFLRGQSLLPLDSVESLLAQHPRLMNYRKVISSVDWRRNQLSTTPGNSFKDFTVVNDGVEHKLSDIVGKGDYVLLDFWAYWCYPCRAEMPYIRNVYERFKDKNFKVISVAISDSPEKDLNTAADLGISWDVWTDGYDASQLYGVSAIPSLILFAPDGTILRRDLRSGNLLSAISDYLNQ